VAPSLRPPYQRIRYKGVTLNRRTVSALEWAAKRAGVDLLLAQGSYTGGAVAASGTTHNGGGAVDVRVVNLTTAERVQVVRAMKDAGFAVWHRAAVPGLWGEHIHGILIADSEMSSGAMAQVMSYDAGRDGLRGNRADNTYRPSPRVRWSHLQGRPVKR
jgi:hypothetical protein